MRANFQIEQIEFRNDILCLYPTNNKEPLSKRGLEILWTFHEFRPLSNPAPVAKVAQVRQQTLLRSCKTAAILQWYVY